MKFSPEDGQQQYKLNKSLYTKRLCLQKMDVSLLPFDV